eukprot:CAMPEP_0184691928 /NCGR_PEP_ID=MMETSP0313-20130426/616_1 /TAXON_ID=2792 /ORGANISM="Porphyridium aerugineum, Strain SAG 1380-2" /LENGTH=336 /DNA_ID=CAMNT_0027149711 /DNA_START=690 /DNA_END=1700 /DNA_ORIENTATION=+
MDNHMNYKNDESLPFIEQLDQLFRMGCQKNQANIENAKMQQQVQHQRINHALPLSSSHFPPSSPPPSTIMPVYPTHNTASLMQNNLFMDFNASSLLIQSQDTAAVAVAAAQAIMSEPSMMPETDSDIAMPAISMAPPPPPLLPKRSTPSLHQTRNGSPVFAATAAAGSAASPPHGGSIDLEEKDPSPESIPTQTISDPASNPSPHPLKVSKSEGDAMFPPSSLSSSSPGMTERDIMLIRRKLRNRASAKRSRIKREKEIQDLEINHQLREKEIHKLKQENMRLRVQNERLNIELMMFQRTRATGQPVAPSSNMNTNANMNMNMVPPPPDNPSGGFQ